MEGRLDHLEKELSDWEAREQKFKKLFGNSVVDSKAFLKEKLAFYEVLDLKYGSKGPGLDQMGRQLVKQEKRKLERKVFPNLIARIVYKLVAAVVAKQQVARYDTSQADNLKSIQVKVIATGFEGLENIIAQKSGQGLQEFSVPVSEQISESQKMDYELKFRKGTDGNYQFEEYRAKLSDRQHNESNACLLEPSMKPEQAYNLLCGRPVLKTGPDQSSAWVQIDMNDKDDKGNLKIRSISREVGFDLATSLDKLPLKNADEVKRTMQSALEKGQQVNTILELKGKEYYCNLIASPLRNEITIFNEKMERLSPVDLKCKTSLAAGEAKELEKVNRRQMKVAR